MGLHALDRAARLGRWGRHIEAIDAYVEACRAPLEKEARYAALVGHARSLEAIGELARAMDRCREAISCAPSQSPAHGMLALLLTRTGALEEAAAAAAEACRRDDASAEMLCLKAGIELQRGNVDQALVAAAAALRRDPGSQRALALRFIARGHESGGASTQMPEVKRLVRIQKPRISEGLGRSESFEVALAEAIRLHPALEPSGSDTVLVNGGRLHDVFALAPALATAIREMFLSAARAYADELPNDAPLATARGGARGHRLSVRGWANVMGTGGYEKPHIHEGAWLSGVYYPRLPESGGQGGDLVFGLHDLGPSVPSPEPYSISPAPGQLVMFPSWLYHCTTPMTGTGMRISVAVDVLSY